MIVGPGGGSADTKHPYLLIAASDAPQAVKDQADVVCTGTNDAAAINTALTSLSTHQERYVEFSRGNFQAEAPIVFNGDGWNIKGNGVGEFSQAVADLQTGTRIHATAGFIGSYIVDVPGNGSRPSGLITIQDLLITGDRSGGNTATTNGLRFSSFKGKLESVHVGDCNGNGIEIVGYNGWQTYDTMAYNCFAKLNTGYGLYLAGESPDMHFFGCVFDQNGVGVQIESASQQFTNCHTYGNETCNVYFNNAGSRTKFVNLKCEQVENGPLVHFEAPTNAPVDVIFEGCNFANPGRSATTQDGVAAGPPFYEHPFINFNLSVNISRLKIADCTFARNPLNSTDVYATYIFDFNAPGRFVDSQILDNNFLAANAQLGMMNYTTSYGDNGVLIYGNSGLETTYLSPTGEKNSAYTATSGQLIGVRSDQAAVTITAPANPHKGAVFAVTDSRSNAATNNITINGNGQDINNSSTPLVLNVDGEYAELIYMTVGAGWVRSR